jgi:hypothetical protein
VQIKIDQKGLVRDLVESLRRLDLPAIMLDEQTAMAEVPGVSPEQGTRALRVYLTVWEARHPGCSVRVTSAREP